MEHAGTLLRRWRNERNLSQMQLGLNAEISARHISFIETGRARPGRGVLLVLASQLDIPLRERNLILQAAGYPPAYRETDLATPEMKEVRETLSLVLEHHQPYPAVVTNVGGDILQSNQAGSRLVELACQDSEAVLEDGPPNIYRVLTHPGGVRRHMKNWENVVSQILYRADKEAGIEQNQVLGEVLESIRRYPDVPGPEFDPTRSSSLLIPIVFDLDGRVIRFLSTIASLGTAIDITLLELRVETWFPADKQSSANWLAIVDELSAKQCK